MTILDQHFYNKTVTLYSSIVGNCFSDIKIERDKGLIKVPIAYAAQQKYNVITDQDEDPNLVRFMKTTPRMSFRLLGWTRDVSRVKNKMHRLTNMHKVGATGDIKAQYNRVPYRFSYVLDVTTKYLDDLLQIFEQIAVVFNPSIQIVVKDNPNIDDESALTITLDDTPFEDSFEGIYETGREITCSFNFTLEGYLYMPTRDGNIIKTVYVNYYDLGDPEKILDNQTFTEVDALSDEDKASGI